MASYSLTVVGYPASDSTGAYEWRITGARGQQLAAGRGTLTEIGNAAPLSVERLTYHALLAGLQALLAEDDAVALTIAAAPAKSCSCDRATIPMIRASSGCDGTLTRSEQLLSLPFLIVSGTRTDLSGCAGGSIRIHLRSTVQPHRTTNASAALVRYNSIYAMKLGSVFSGAQPRAPAQARFSPQQLELVIDKNFDHAYNCRQSIADFLRSIMLVSSIPTS